MKLSKILLTTMLSSAMGVQAQNKSTLQNKKDTIGIGCDKPKKEKNKTLSDTLKSKKDSNQIKHYDQKCEACGRG